MQISSFVKFKIKLWHYFQGQMCTYGYHLIAWSVKKIMEVVTNRLLNYSGHGGAKADLRSKKN